MRLPPSASSYDASGATLSQLPPQLPRFPTTVYTSHSDRRYATAPARGVVRGLSELPTLTAYSAHSTVSLSHSASHNDLSTPLAAVIMIAYTLVSAPYLQWVYTPADRRGCVFDCSYRTSITAVAGAFFSHFPAILQPVSRHFLPLFASLCLFFASFRRPFPTLPYQCALSLSSPRIFRLTLTVD